MLPILFPVLGVAVGGVIIKKLLSDDEIKYKDMANLHNQFLKFEQVVSLTKTKKSKLISSRKALQKRIIEFFRTKTKVPVPKFYIQGSYKMQTMVIKKDGTYDVDLGVYFLTKPNIEPLTLQKYVANAVKDQTVSGIEHKEKCIRVIYKGDFDIDLPVYYKTPTDKHPFLATKTKWQQSDPKELCDWFEAQRKQKDKNGQMLRLVKYFKAWANQRSRKMPSGIAFTVWVANNYQPDNRVIIDEPLFIAIDNIWKLINQPMLNKKYPVQSGAYIFDLFAFNEEVIREAVLNAIAHRDYSITSEVVIKQFPNKITITNPGGFPKGVTIENLLTVSSTPRSRLMTEILEKTGLVERSGQGVDKIFSITLSEGKAEPDYKNSDMFQVSLTLQTEIIDKAFHVFVNQYQNSEKEPKLGVEQIITLCKIRNGIFQNLKSEIVSQLERSRLIEKISGHTNRYTLSEDYHKLVNEGLKIGKRYIVKEIELIILALQGNALKMGELEENLKESLNRNQIKYLTGKLFEDEVLSKDGKGSGTSYTIHKSFSSFRGEVLIQNVISFLNSKYEQGNSPKAN